MTLVPMVVEQDGRGERAFDLFSMLLRNRIVYCTGQIEDHMAAILSAQLVYLESLDPDKPVYLYINSPGGVVTAGYAVIDTMNYVKCDVYTLCIGQAASMAAMILACGASGNRMCLPNARVMVHQPSGGAHGQASDIAIQAREIIKMRTNLNRLLKQATGQTLAAIEAVMERDTFMDAGRGDGVRDHRSGGDHAAAVTMAGTERGGHTPCLTLCVASGTLAFYQPRDRSDHVSNLHARNPDARNTRPGIADGPRAHAVVPQRRR